MADNVGTEPMINEVEKIETAAKTEVELIKERLIAVEQRLVAELKEIENRIKASFSHIGAEYKK